MKRQNAIGEDFGLSLTNQQYSFMIAIKRDQDHTLTTGYGCEFKHVTARQLAKFGLIEMVESGIPAASNGRTHGELIVWKLKKSTL